MAIVETTVCRKLQSMYRSRAELARRTRITGTIAGSALRDCEVLVFALPDHPEASCCYVWEAEGRVHTALEPRALEPPPQNSRWNGHAGQLTAF